MTFVRKKIVMKPLFMTALLLAFAIFLLIFVGRSPVVLADSPVASAWAKSPTASFRLVAATVPNQFHQAGISWAGLQIRIVEGGKTYWRSPGEAGLPPNLDWSKSKNLKEIKILWPIPHRFDEAGSTAVGYKGDVMLPLQIIPKNPQQPVELDLSLFIGICTNICIPVNTKIQYSLPAQHGVGVDISEAMNIIPVPVKADKTGDYIKSLKLVPPAAGSKDKKASLQVEVSFPNGSSDHELFLEAPEEFMISLPRPLRMEPTMEKLPRRQIYTIGLEDIDTPKALVGKKLRLTLISDKGAFDLETSLK